MYWFQWVLSITKRNMEYILPCLLFACILLSQHSTWDRLRGSLVLQCVSVGILALHTHTIGSVVMLCIQLCCAYWCLALRDQQQISQQQTEIAVLRQEMQDQKQEMLDSHLDQRAELCRDHELQLRYAELEKRRMRAAYQHESFARSFRAGDFEQALRDVEGPDVNLEARSQTLLEQGHTLSNREVLWQYAELVQHFRERLQMACLGYELLTERR